MSAAWNLQIVTRWRLVQLRNTVDQQLRDSPWRVFVIIGLLFVIWAALYALLTTVLEQISRWELVAVVADTHIFVHFFLVLAVMLAFSNAILAFSNLFGRTEAGHLLAMPTQARQIVLVKWIEGLLLSSWSFFLLGVPVMLAVARNSTVEWYYYPLFVGHFAGFVVIPATFGLLVAWAVAMYAPRRPLVVWFLAGAAVGLLLLLWLWKLMRHVDRESEEWLPVLFQQLSLAKQPLLPSTWSAKGIKAAIDKHLGESLLYLGAIAANGAFFAWVTINIIARTWSEAYSRAQVSTYVPIIRRGWVTAAVCRLVFFYLPPRLQTIMLKDVRGFVRDTMQWTQMVIMLGLLVIYAMNLKRLPVDLTNDNMRGLIAFLNLTVISLILATFTSRFVFPLLSLESQQLWLLGLLPLERRAILLVKFLFALKVTGLASLVVMAISVRALDLPAHWAVFQVIVCLSICVGLCGLSVGLGACFPVFGERNPARIASGFGGTMNLIASMVFVSLEMAGVVYLGVRQLGQNFAIMEPVAGEQAFVVLLAILGIAVAVSALWIGARRFERLEY
jgi:ABC-2 type transport system permease protein